MRVAEARPLARISQQPGRYAYRVILALVVLVPFAALLFAIRQLWDQAVGWTEVLLLVGMYLPISLGVTAGFHRMLTHKSFVAHPIVKFVLLVLGSMAIEGNCIGWAAD